VLLVKDTRHDNGVDGRLPRATDFDPGDEVVEARVSTRHDGV